MPLQKSWPSRIVVGISVIFAVWLMVLFISGGWLSDAPGYPLSVIGAGAWLVLVRVGWSISRLCTATGYQHIPRIIDVIAGLLLAVGLVFGSINLIAQSSAQPSPIPSPFWLLPVAIILGVVANLIESGWGKTNVSAWLRVIGAAVIGATLLLGFLIAWSVFYH
jgi:hypothetical protein